MVGVLTWSAAILDKGSWLTEYLSEIKNLHDLQQRQLRVVERRRWGVSSAEPEMVDKAIRPAALQGQAQTQAKCCCRGGRSRAGGASGGEKGEAGVGGAVEN